MATRVTGQRLRRAHTFDVVLSDGAVTLRRLDLMNQWLLGKVEQSLITQVYSAERVFAMMSPGVNTLEALEALPAEERRELLNGLRRYASLAVVSPRVTFEDDGDPDAVPVELFEFPDLMAIWNAKPPASVGVDPDQPLALPAQAGGAGRFPAAAPDPESSESARDHPEGTRRYGAVMALPAERAPYPGLVSLTTH